MADKLNAGDAFPALELAALGGDTLALPAFDGGARYRVILFYRGHW